jgi:hypothetical protein
MTTSKRAKTTFGTALACSFASGFAIELLIGMFAGRREAWDSGMFWVLGYPAMILAAYVFGSAARVRPLLIGYAPFAGLLIAMLLKTGAGPLLPLGIIMMVFLGLPALLAAWWGARRANA